MSATQEDIHSVFATLLDLSPTLAADENLKHVILRFASILSDFLSRIESLEHCFEVHQAETHTTLENRLDAHRITLHDLSAHTPPNLDNRLNELLQRLELIDDRADTNILHRVRVLEDQANADPADIYSGAARVDDSNRPPYQLQLDNLTSLAEKHAHRLDNHDHLHKNLELSDFTKRLELLRDRVADLHKVVLLIPPSAQPKQTFTAKEE